MDGGVLIFFIGSKGLIPAGGVADVANNAVVRANAITTDPKVPFLSIRPGGRGYGAAHSRPT